VDEVTVLSTPDYGAFVRIREGIEALIPAGEVPVGTSLKAGDRVKAEVSNVDSQDRRITMSLRNVGVSSQAEQLAALNREKQDTKATLGDLLKDKLGEKLQAMRAAEQKNDAS
jgi:small subunit ribosomal protein S1